MKRIALTLIIALSLIVTATAQENEEKLRELENLEQKTEVRIVIDTVIAIEQDTLIATEEGIPMADEEEIIIDEEEDYDSDTTTVRIGDIVTVEESDDETVIRIGKKGIRIAEDEDDTEVSFEEYDDETESSFRGHVGGIELGFCGYFTEPWKTSLDPADSYMNLNTTKSMNFNLMLPNINLGFSRHFGMAAAIGLSWSDYYFDGNNSITKDADGNIIPVYPEEDINYEKSKLSTTYAHCRYFLKDRFRFHITGQLTLAQELSEQLSCTPIPRWSTMTVTR